MESNARRPIFWRRKFVEFCKRTDLHGYKYIVMKELHFYERIFWALAVLLSTGSAGYFVMTAYKWYARNPIITVIESTHGAIWDVPFPAVTICDMNYVSRKHARWFSDLAQLPDNMTSDELFLSLKYAPLLHSRIRISEDHKKILYRLQDVLDLNQYNVKKLFDLIGPDHCKDLVQRCMWKNAIYRCELLFQKILSVHTLCCTFNYYAIDPPKPIENQLFRPKTPRRVSSCGYQTALTVLLNIEPDDYYSSSVSSYGAMVFIDNAYNFPNLNSPMQIVNPHMEVFIALAPERTYATSGVARFGTDVRQCYYSNEVKVGNFKLYSYHNCMAYRSALKTFRTCGCSPYYLQVEESNRTCNFRDIECLQKLRQLSTYNTNADSEIHCLPDCEHYDYPFEVAMGLLVQEAPVNNLIFFKDIKMKNHSILNVFFNDLVSTRYRREVYLNWQNLLSSFGGLMSLMLGFTVISGFDLTIFFLYRIVYDSIKSIFWPLKKENHRLVYDRKTKSQSMVGNQIEQYIVSKKQKKLQYTDPPRYEDTERY